MKRRILNVYIYKLKCIRNVYSDKLRTHNPQWSFGPKFLTAILTALFFSVVVSSACAQEIVNQNMDDTFILGEIRATSLVDILSNTNITHRQCIRRINIKYQQNKTQTLEYLIDALVSVDTNIQFRAMATLKNLNIRDRNYADKIAGVIFRTINRAYANKFYGNGNLGKLILLAYVYRHRAIEKLLITMMDDRDVPSAIRKRCIQTLGKIQSGAAVSKLIEMMKSDDGDLCLPAMDALIRMKYPEIEHRIFPMLVGSNKKIRLRCVVALSKIGTEKSAPHLMELLERERDGAVILQTCKALEKITGESFIGKYFTVDGGGSFSLKIER